MSAATSNWQQRREESLPRLIGHGNNSRLRRSASSERGRAVSDQLQLVQAATAGPANSPAYWGPAQLPRGASLTGISRMAAAHQPGWHAGGSGGGGGGGGGDGSAASCDAASGEFIAAVQRGDIAVVLGLLSQGQKRYPMGGASKTKFNVNAQLNNGMSALHQAAFNGNVQMMHVLLDNGAAVDLQDSRGLRPIHVASFQGHFDAVHLLLKWSSCVNSAALGALTPLHLACQAGHYDVVKLLLCNNAEPMRLADDGRSAFHVACEFGRFSIVQLLMSLKSVTGVPLFEDVELYPQSPPQQRRPPAGTHSPNSQAAPPQSCRGGRPPPSCLHLAAKNGHVDVLRLLLSQPGVNINRVTDQGTCLHMAAFYGHVEAAKLLLEQGIDPGLTNAHGRTAKEVITRDTPHARELHQILFERMSAVGAVATRDFCNLADPRSIAFRCGEHVTVLERSCPDTWKGFVTREGLSRAGYFPSSAVRLQQHPYHHHLPEGLVPCSVPQPPAPHPDAVGGVSPSSVVVDAACAVGNRNSAASLDSGRSSAHTATSSDTRSVFAAASGIAGSAAFASAGSASASAAAQSPSAASAAAAAAASPGSSAAAAAAAAVAAAINSSTDSGLGPHRQSIVSTCSSTGSLGSSLPDDSSSVSSGEHQQQQQQQCQHQLPDNWHRMSPGEQLSAFLWGCQLSGYQRCLADAGYDLPTLVRCTPEDLNAAGLTNPRDRKRLRLELGRLGQALQAAGLPDPLEEAAAASARQRHLDDVGEFCTRLGLPDCAAASLRGAGLVTVRDLAQMAWEDLEEVGISRLGHQKKLMLAIDRVRRPPRCRPGGCPDTASPDCGPDACSSSPSSSAGCATLRRQQGPGPARQTVSCGTCTTTDLIMAPDADCLAAEEPPPTPHAQAHARSCSDTSAAACCLAASAATDSPTTTPVRSPSAVVRPVAKVPGRPIPVPVPEVPTEKSAAAAAAASSRVPPPPPKRVTSVRRCSADTTPCASPTLPPRDSLRRLPATAAYENAAALMETAAARLAAASASSVSAIPFANEDCGTIRHKPHAAVAAYGGVAASPQFQRRQQHQQLTPASPAFARRVAHTGSSTGSPLLTPRSPPAAAVALSPAHAAAAAAATAHRLLQPPTPRDDDSLTNLDDICGMLSDLQCILDRELREHQT